MGYTLILWDVDGTLLDFDRSEKAALGQCFARRGHAFTDGDLSRFHQINRELWRGYETGALTKAEVVRTRFARLFAAMGIRGEDEAAFNLDYQQTLAQLALPLPGAVETVRALHGRCRQCVVSNGSAITQYPRLRRSGLDAYMEHIFLSEEVGAPKPDGAFFDHCLAQLGPVPREKMLLIGDSLTSDMLGGYRAGIPTCWYNPAALPRPAQPPITWEIRALAQVPALALSPEGA